MSYETIIFEKDQNVATITLNRPDKLNAWNGKMQEEMDKAINDVIGDNNIRALIIAGAGRGFCAGLDVSAMAELAKLGLKGGVEKSVAWIAPQLRNMDKPVIAAVHGMCMGLGVTVALACDIRIASDDAKFSMAFIKRGVVPDTGTTYFLPRTVGTGNACELIFTGDPIDAKEAERIGLVNRVVPQDKLMTAAKDLATRIAQNPPISVRLAKAAIYKGLDADLLSQVQYEIVANRIAMTTEDHKEAIASFMEKRAPQFKGR